MFTRVTISTLVLMFSTFTLCASCSASSEHDKFLWLEEIESDSSLEWVKQQNKATSNKLMETDLFKSIYEQSKAIRTAENRLTAVYQFGDHYYSILRDKKHSRGLLRRTSIGEYSKNSPTWEAVLDIDKLAEEENENWFFGGVDCLPPIEAKCFIKFSRGGGNALVAREFDMVKKQFVSNGFYVPESKHSVSWVDENTVDVATDYGEGTLTESGYASVVKRWKRGTSLEDATSVFQTELSHLGVFLGNTFVDGEVVNYIVDYVSYFVRHVYIESKGKWKKVDKPATSSMLGIFGDYILIQNKEEMTIGQETVPPGSLIYDNLIDVLDDKANYRVLAKSSDKETISEVQLTKNAIVVNWTKDVSSELSLFKLRDNKFFESTVALPKNGSIRIRETKPFNSDFLVMYESFLKPYSIFRVNDLTNEITPLKQQPETFDASLYVTKQNFAISKDGTKIPYFLVMSKAAEANQKNPTLIHAYGGFEISKMPTYSNTLGATWLEKGGVYVLANIRGGGEYGPKWHQAAMKMNRHKAFEDFEAVTQDLIARNITQPKYIGIQGESNGGLLMGVMLTRSPQLFSAVISSVPLMDMLRYTKLSAGSSWVDEYGDPEVPEEREYLVSYSPYHNIEVGAEYPAVLIHTTTTDDLVHPAHARKMAAKMQKMGHSAYYYELTDGGHVGASTNEKLSLIEALWFTFLQQKLMLENR